MTSRRDWSDVTRDAIVASIEIVLSVIKDGTPVESLGSNGTGPFAVTIGNRRVSFGAQHGHGDPTNAEPMLWYNTHTRLGPESPWKLHRKPTLAPIEAAPMMILAAVSSLTDDQRPAPTVPGAVLGSRPDLEQIGFAATHTPTKPSVLR